MLKCIGAAGIIFLFCSCANFAARDTGTQTVFSPDLRSEQYSSEIKRFCEIALKEKDKTKRAEAYYNLAKLFASYKNPARSYLKSYQYLLKSAETDKAVLANYEFKNTLTLLEYLHALTEENKRYEQKVAMEKESVEKLKNEIAASRKNEKKLTVDNIRLIKENVDLKLSIERLKDLDIEIERKRKDLR
jgi:hypothetical protein